MSVTSDTLQVTSGRPGDKSAVHGYKKLRVWQLADQLAHEVYKATRNFPNEEQFGLVSQLRRSAVSVPTNLVEGQARKSRKEFRQFISMSLSSLAEVEYLLEFSYAEQYVADGVYQSLSTLRQETGRLLWRLYESL
ncbi:MAG: four helix bundle protein [Candidatus Omnitrophica bacterium CG11_big_fil_rev_8_21_14_0_20_63_9]|nr:MAG: four helix bundle protein [Candidatus Omnitrophica bacterium CG11_big_fil_rev_8_21_14_0_20_63_9]